MQPPKFVLPLSVFIWWRKRHYRPLLRHPADISATPHASSGTGSLACPEVRRVCAPLSRNNPSDLGFHAPSHSTSSREGL